MKPLNAIGVQTTEPQVLDVSRKLARAIYESAPFRKYEETTERLRADKEAQRILSEFRKAQQNLQMMQSWGGATEKDFKQFEKLQVQLFSNPTLKEYFKAQEDLVTKLKELNVFISEKLGFDFANLTKPAGGCC